MEIHDLLKTLESLGTAQNRKVYTRHGVSGAQFGVSFANLEKLRKQIKKDHALARQLWASGNHDARILATMIADPQQADEALLNAWVTELDNYGVADAFADYATKTPLARSLAERWIASESEYPSRSGWHILAQLALKDTALPDEYFRAHLSTIAVEIHTRPNRTRQGMHNALMAFGARSDALLALALDAAARIGPVEIDHGETGCKTPDTIPYMQKARQHRKKKELAA
jgi:3-methyladenine DNA glycosylase AlkD